MEVVIWLAIGIGAVIWGFSQTKGHPFWDKDKRKAWWSFYAGPPKNKR